MDQNAPTAKQIESDYVDAVLAEALSITPSMQSDTVTVTAFVYLSGDFSGIMVTADLTDAGTPLIASRIPLPALGTDHDEAVARVVAYLNFLLATFK